MRYYFTLIFLQWTAHQAEHRGVIKLQFHPSLPNEHAMFTTANNGQ